MLNLDDVKALLDQRQGEDVLSLYLNVDNAVPENQADNPAWRIWLKKQLRHVDDHLEEADRATWEAIQQRVNDFFSDYTPSSKGLVAFFGQDWDQIHRLPVPLENEGAYGRPLIGPLLWTLDEYQPYLVVQVDQEEAHFYLSYLGQTEFRESMEIDIEQYDFGEKTGIPAATAASAGFGGTQPSKREGFENMLDEHRMRFYRSVADYTRRLIEQEEVRRVILGGDEQAAHTLRKQLPDAVQRCVIDVISIPRHYSTHEVFRHVQPLALDYERQEEAKQVDEVINMARAGGRGALGVKAVQAALDLQQVSELIIAWPPVDAEQANDLAYRALQLNSAITMVHDVPANHLRAESSGGIAAKLYYAIREEEGTEE